MRLDRDFWAHLAFSAFILVGCYLATCAWGLAW